MARFRFPGDPYADRSNAEERARESWQAEHTATIEVCRRLLTELESALDAENLPAIEWTQETLADAVDNLADARRGPQYPSGDSEDYREDEER